MHSLKKSCELILALDVESLAEAKKILKEVGPQLKWVKIGLQLFTLYGPSIVKSLSDLGYNIFLDLKFHDIPNQVASAIRSLRELPIGLLTLHTSGGEEMIRWANQARNDINHPMQLLGITVLTSMDEKGLKLIGIDVSPEEQVLKLGVLGMQSGLQGLVCSPLELPQLRKKLGPDPILVTPGIRPIGSDSNEQKRIMSPKEASIAGASYIVIGRPILKAANPAETVESILKEIQNV